ncbi:MAG: hypothetical protein H0W96_17455 [Solirubrobacterales bacterium]|nr:hypothetical protein [Solirubrobacterales bacterium]
MDADRLRSSQEVGDVLATELQPAAVAQRRDQLAVPLEQPLGVDCREVGDASGFV